MTEHEQESLLSAYLDGELDAPEDARIASHLEQCDSCRSSLADLQETKETLRFAARKTLPSDLALKLQALLSPKPTRLSIPYWMLSPKVWAPAALVAAACAVLVFKFGINNPDRYVPLEPLLAAHSRYSAESLVPQTSLATSNYSAHLASLYGDAPDREIE